MNNYPEITIGLPLRNRARFLKRRLNSILSQSFKNFELIISDNASTDDTKEICKKYQKKDERIAYIKQKRNLGIARNFIFVLTKARGKYFIWAADDDQWEKNFLTRLKAGLDKNNKCGVAMCSTERRYVDGRLRDRISFSGKKSLNYLNYRQVFAKMMKGDPIHIFIYGLFRTEILRKMTKRPFPTCMAGDRVFMCQTALTTRFFSLGDFLYFRRVYKKPINQRYKTSSIGDEWSNPKRNVKYILTLFKFLITSDTIPFYRKFWIFPYWFLLIWRNRNLLVYELFPRYNRLRKKIDTLFSNSVG